MRTRSSKKPRHAIQHLYTEVPNVPPRYLISVADHIFEATATNKAEFACKIKGPNLLSAKRKHSNWHRPLVLGVLPPALLPDRKAVPLLGPGTEQVTRLIVAVLVQNTRESKSSCTLLEMPWSPFNGTSKSSGRRTPPRPKCYWCAFHLINVAKIIKLLRHKFDHELKNVFTKILAGMVSFFACSRCNHAPRRRTESANRVEF